MLELGPSCLISEIHVLLSTELRLVILIFMRNLDAVC